MEHPIRAQGQSGTMGTARRGPGSVEAPPPPARVPLKASGNTSHVVLHAASSRSDSTGNAPLIANVILGHADEQARPRVDTDLITNTSSSSSNSKTDFGSGTRNTKEGKGTHEHHACRKNIQSSEFPQKRNFSAARSESSDSKGTSRVHRAGPDSKKPRPESKHNSGPTTHGVPSSGASPDHTTTPSAKNSHPDTTVSNHRSSAAQQQPALPKKRRKTKWQKPESQPIMRAAIWEIRFGRSRIVETAQRYSIPLRTLRRYRDISKAGGQGYEGVDGKGVQFKEDYDSQGRLITPLPPRTVCNFRPDFQCSRFEEDELEATQTGGEARRAPVTSHPSHHMPSHFAASRTNLVPDHLSNSAMSTPPFQFAVHGAPGMLALRPGPPGANGTQQHFSSAMSGSPYFTPSSYRGMYPANGYMPPVMPSADRLAAGHPALAPQWNVSPYALQHNLPQQHQQSMQQQPQQQQQQQQQQQHQQQQQQLPQGVPQFMPPPLHHYQPQNSFFASQAAYYPYQPGRLMPGQPPPAPRSNTEMQTEMQNLDWTQQGALPGARTLAQELAQIPGNTIQTNLSQTNPNRFPSS